jgi:predicted nucleotidyltransferase
MLDPDRLELDGLCLALDDHSPDTTWWIESGTGQIRVRGPGAVDDPEDLTAAGWVQIGSTESHEGYRDMADFVANVQHPRASDLLVRAIAGRGAFRRFKDTLLEFPELRDQWFRFRDARSRRRALRWLAGAGLITREAAEVASARYPDPAPTTENVPAAVAADLAQLYGDRLRQVLVFGSWGRGNGSPETDLDLLVVLSDVDSAWDELQRMDELLWRHTERSGVLIAALPMSQAEFGRPTTPSGIRAKSEAVRVG